jgi:hypothetical protein
VSFDVTLQVSAVSFDCYQRLGCEVAPGSDLEVCFLDYHCEGEEVENYRIKNALQRIAKSRLG